MIRGQEFHSILQNIFEDVQGHLQSEQLQVNCPRCQEREGLSHPDGSYNLEINTARRVFRCWKCDEPRFSGSLGKLIGIFGSSVDRDMYKSYAGVFQDQFFDEEKEYVAVKLPDEMITFAQMEATNPEHFEAYNYLVNERKLTRDIILRYRLGFCTTGKYAKRIIIPSYDKNGDINYFVGRYYGNEKKIRKKMPYLNPEADKGVIIFNEGLINWDSTVYLVEGAFEMLSFPVNAIPMLGKTLSTTLFLKLKELKPNVVVLLDPDAYKSSVELYYMLYTIYIGCEERVKIVKLPTNDDLDELRRNDGHDAVLTALYSARGLVLDDYFIQKLQKPYEKKGAGRHGTYSKYFEWKSASAGDSI